MKHQTPDSMKFQKLARRLGLRRFEAIGVLESLWIATQVNAPAGDIGRFDNEEIAIAIGWDRDPDELVQELVNVGWLDECSKHRLVVHDWPEHAPRYVHGLVAKTGGFATATIEADYRGGLQTGTIDPDCTRQQPNLTKPNLTKPNQKDVPNGVPPSGPTALSFPVKSADSRDWLLLESKVTEWAETYGDREWVMSELRKARQYVIDNPSKRKTPGGMVRYLSGWLARTNNRSGTPQAHSSHRRSVLDL